MKPKKQIPNYVYVKLLLLAMIKRFVFCSSFRKISKIYGLSVFNSLLLFVVSVFVFKVFKFSAFKLERKKSIS